MVNDRFTSFRLAVKDKPTKPVKNGQKKLNNKKISELSDIEEALRSLEIQDGQNSNKACNCAARKHPLNTVTPNCLNCGKILCCKNSSTTCTFCNEKLLSNDELEAIMTVLHEEQAKLVTQTSKSNPGTGDSSAALDKANSTLSRLLEYQDTSAIRTNIIDQASDFALPGSGHNKWATATEQAEQLKRQQRMLKQQKKKNDRLQGRGSNVVSIDLKGNKVVLNTNNDYDYDEPESDEEPANIRKAVQSSSNLKSSSSSKTIDKKFIAPAYNKTSTLSTDRVVEQPRRLQTPGDDAYLEL